MAESQWVENDGAFFSLDFCDFVSSPWFVTCVLDVLGVFYVLDVLGGSMA